MPATSGLKRQTVSHPKAKLGPMLPSFSVQMITRESNKLGPLASSVDQIVVGLKPGIDKTLLPSLEDQTVREVPANDAAKSICLLTNQT